MATDLYDEWEAPGGAPGMSNKDRPAWVRENRERLEEIIDTDEPLPSADESLTAFRDWLERHKGTVTSQLSAAAGDGGSA